MRNETKQKNLWVAEVTIQLLPVNVEVAKGGTREEKRGKLLGEDVEADVAIASTSAKPS